MKTATIVENLVQAAGITSLVHVPDVPAKITGLDSYDLDITTPAFLAN